MPPHASPCTGVAPREPCLNMPHHASQASRLENQSVNQALKALLTHPGLLPSLAATTGCRGVAAAATPHIHTAGWCGGCCYRGLHHAANTRPGGTHVDVHVCIYTWRHTCIYTHMHICTHTWRSKSAAGHHTKIAVKALPRDPCRHIYIHSMGTLPHVFCSWLASRGNSCWGRRAGRQRPG